MVEAGLGRDSPGGDPRIADLEEEALRRVEERLLLGPD